MRKVLHVVVAAVVMALASAVTGGGSSEASAWLLAPAACSLNNYSSDEGNVLYSIGRGVNYSTTSTAGFQCALISSDWGYGPFPDTENLSLVSVTVYDGSPGSSVVANIGSYDTLDYYVYSLCSSQSTISGTGYSELGWLAPGGLSCMLPLRLPAGWVNVPPHTGTTASKFISMRVGGL